MENLAWLEGIIFDQDKKGTEYADKCLEINSENEGALFVKAQCEKDGETAKRMVLDII